jgi:hypothetical protein
VKLPKALRQGLRELVASPSGRAVLEEALAAAGAALATAQAKPVSKSRRAAAGQAPSPEAAAATARSAAASALEDAAHSFTEALRRRDLAETPPQSVPEPSPASTH